MQKAWVYGLASALSQLGGFDIALARIEQHHGAAQTLNDQMAADLTKPLMIIMRESGNLGFTSTYQATSRFVGRLKTHPNVATVRADIRNVRDLLFDELRRHQFVSVPLRKARFFDNPSLFGTDVRRAFPSAVNDVREAGNCLAIGFSTAAVFHLMRAAEYGLRALAKNRRVTFPAPLELQEWHSIIEKVEASLKALDQAPKSAKKIAALEFYRGAVGEFRAFKDAWRNHVMHSRAMYTESEAEAIMLHVREFMMRLAKRVGERKQQKASRNTRKSGRKHRAG